MSFNNGPYIFSDVPGYEASKGERIVKAFRKLWTKINHLEQAKILEKTTRSQEVQTNSDSDLTINDIKYEILLTQLRYIIKIVRDYANEDSLNSPDCLEVKTGSDITSSSNNLRPIHEGLNVQHEVQKDCPPCFPVSEMASNELRDQEERGDTIDHPVSTTGTQTSTKVDAVDTTSHSHYHLKLNDVPFILGASATASHSVVANVQNIIALMKNHNKALCASKPSVQKEATSTKIHKSDTQDTNKMIRQLSEDLSKLTMKQEKLKAMLDNASSHSSDTKTQISQHNKAEEDKKFETLNNIDGAVKSTSTGAGQSISTGVLQKNSYQISKKKSGTKFGNQEKHIVPAVRIQTNENPQLARRKMLRTLKDFKTHLSEEDLSWK